MLVEEELNLSLYFNGINFGIYDELNVCLCKC
jgi:hypothetical protein